jgi:hypothetical protein
LAIWTRSDIKDERKAIKFSYYDDTISAYVIGSLPKHKQVAYLSSTRDKVNALSLQSPDDVASLIFVDATIVSTKPDRI